MDMANSSVKDRDDVEKFLRQFYPKWIFGESYFWTERKTKKH